MFTAVPIPGPARLTPNNRGAETIIGPFGLSFGQEPGVISVTYDPLSHHVIRFTNVPGEPLGFLRDVFASGRISSPAGILNTLGNVLKQFPDTRLTIQNTPIQNRTLGDFVAARQERGFYQWQVKYGQGPQIVEGSALARAVLLDPQGCREIIRRLGRRFFAAGLDFSGMGDGNSYGHMALINHFLRLSQDRALALFGRSNFISPWGGDERTVLATDRRLITEYKNIHREVRQEVFADVDLTPLNKCLKERQVYRRLIDKFYESGWAMPSVDPSSVDKLFARCEGLPEARLSPQALQLFAHACTIAETEPDLPADFFLNLSGGVIEFDADLHGEDPEVLVQAITEAYRVQMKTKGKDGLVDAGRFVYRADYHTREDALLATSQQMASQRALAVELGQRVQSSDFGLAVASEICKAVSLADPTLTKADGSPFFALHAASSKELTVGDVGLAVPEVTVVEVKIPILRELNLEGYERANQVFNAFLQRIEATVPGVRKRDGGSLYIATAGAVPQQAIDDLKDDLATYCATHIASNLHRGGSRGALSNPERDRIRMNFDFNRVRKIVDANDRGAPIGDLLKSRFDEPSVEVRRVHNPSQDESFNAMVKSQF